MLPTEALVRNRRPVPRGAGPAGIANSSSRMSVVPPGVITIDAESTSAVGSDIGTDAFAVQFYGHICIETTT